MTDDSLDDVQPNTQPLSQWLNCLFEQTEELMGMIGHPDYRFHDKGALLAGLGLGPDDVLTMAQIATRFQLMASNIEARDQQTLRIVRHVKA